MRFKASLQTATASPLASALSSIWFVLLMFLSCESTFEDSTAGWMSKLFLVEAFAFCFWHGHAGKKSNVVFSLSFTFCSYAIMECESVGFVWCLCMNGISFWCEHNTLGTVLPCLSPVCSHCGNHSQGGGIPLFHRTSALMSSPCGQELLIHGFCSLLLLRSARQLSFFSSFLFFFFFLPFQFFPLLFS